MPVGAYAGSRKLMEQVSPLGAVYQAGTLSGNPVAMAAGLRSWRFSKITPMSIPPWSGRASGSRRACQEIFRKAKVPAQVNRAGSILTVFFSKTPVTGYDQARACDLERFAKWYRGLLEHGLYAAPSSLRPCSSPRRIRRRTSTPSSWLPKRWRRRCNDPAPTP